MPIFKVVAPPTSANIGATSATADTAPEVAMAEASTASFHTAVEGNSSADLDAGSTFSPASASPSESAPGQQQRSPLHHAALSVRTESENNLHEPSCKSDTSASSAPPTSSTSFTNRMSSRIATLAERASTRINSPLVRSTAGGAPFQSAVKRSPLSVGDALNRLSPIIPSSPGRSLSPQTSEKSLQYNSSGKFFVPGTPDMTRRRRRRRGSWSLLGKAREAVGWRAHEPERAEADARAAGQRLRLLRRDAPFRQSTGRIYMHRTGAALGLALSDVFHVALAMPYFLLTLLCMMAYTTVMLAFAVLYVLIEGPETDCGIAPIGERPTFYHAFAFSMETLTTIGYGVPQSGANFLQEQEWYAPGV